MSEGYKIPIDLSDMDKLIKKFDDAAKAVDRLQEKVDKLNGSKIRPDMSFPGGGGGRGGDGGGGGRGGGGGGGGGRGGGGGGGGRSGGGGGGGGYVPKYGTPAHGHSPHTPDHRRPQPPPGYDPSGGGGGGGGGRGGGRTPSKPPRSPDDIDAERREKERDKLYRIITRGAVSLAQGAMQAGGVPAAVRTAANAFLFGAAAISVPAALGAAGAAGLVATAAMGRSIGAERREAMYATGSTAAQAGGLVAMGNNAAGQAAGFGDVLRSGTFSGAYFRNRGLIDYGSLTVNKADNFINAIDIIRREKNRDLKSIIIRESGLSNQSAYVDASERMFNDFARETKGSIVGEKALKAGQRGISDFEVALDIQKKQFGDLATVTAGLPLGAAAGIVQDLTSLVYGMNKENLARTVSGATGMSAWGFTKRMYDLFTNQENAEQKQTRRDNNRNMDPLNERTPRNEISGGGTRVQSSANISQAMSASNAYGLEQAMRIGAFPVY